MANGTQAAETRTQEAHRLDREAFGVAEARAAGFERIGSAPAGDLRIQPEVRAMCAADRCQSFNRSWMCPPACGELDEFETLISRFNEALLVQTVAELEDEFDFEGMQKTARLHGERFGAFACAVRKRSEATRAGDVYFLGAGACTVCPACTYPGEPCRFPNRAFVSMEAAGLVVGDCCRAADIPYYHGPGTVSYTSCLLA